jgi:hypothetical protein
MKTITMMVDEDGLIDVVSGDVYAVELTMGEALETVMGILYDSRIPPYARSLRQIEADRNEMRDVVKRVQELNEIQNQEIAAHINARQIAEKNEREAKEKLAKLSRDAIAMKKQLDKLKPTQTKRAKK